MHGHYRRIRMRSLWRSAVITSAILCVFVITMSAPVPVFAADDSIKNTLPTPGFDPDWVMKDRVILYNNDTLFEHINGEADLYFPYGFDMLATATYVNKKDPELWLVVDVYRMDSLLNAFGIYSNYRRADAAGATIGAEGFVTTSQLMFYQDRYFVRIQVTGATSLEQELFVAFGRNVSQNLPPNTGRPHRAWSTDGGTGCGDEERTVSRAKPPGVCIFPPRDDRRCRNERRAGAGLCGF